MSEEFKRCFLTGSRVYGTPTEKSDIDLVVLVDKETADFLWANTDPNSQSVRYGNLNLIVFTNEYVFLEWLKVTEILIGKKPVTRDEAIAEFNKSGFTDYPTRLMSEGHLVVQEMKNEVI